MGTWEKTSGLMMVDDQTDLEVKRRSITKLYLVWMAQASIQKFTEALEMCI